MRDLLLTILFLSVSGSVIAGLLLALKPVIANKAGKRFYYYLWLLVLLRLCLPVSSPVDLSGVFSRPAEAAADALPAADYAAEPDTDSVIPSDTGAVTPAEETLNESSAVVTPPAGLHQPLMAGGRALNLVKSPITWFTVWAAGSVLSCAWFVGGYWRFASGVRKTSVDAGGDAVRIYNEFSGRGRPKLLISGLVGTPMLIGLFRSVIVLPERAYDDETLRHILRHELCHYRRGDLYYKWFAMLALSLHWFNPLVYVIRRELNRACELACDETVVRDMPMAEKRAYGETLLSLAAGRKLPAGILATTMSEEKAQLKGRLQSIMNHKKASAAASALSIGLALLLCGCSILGGPGSSGADAPENSVPPALTDNSPDVSANEISTASPDGSAVPEGGVALTAEEIDWFNTEFFNGEHPNIHNQFLLSLYETPEDIDLHETFYSGMDSATEAERAALVAANGWEKDQEIDCGKISAADMNAALTENIGLTRDETRGIGLDLMTYLPAYDAYYMYHSDTNYMNVTVTSGYRVGQSVYLDYFGTTYFESERRLRLDEIDGGYTFFSNTEISAPPGAVLNADGVPDEVADQAKKLVLQWYREDSAVFPEYSYVNWRITALEHTYTYDDIDGMTLPVYGMNFEFYSENPERAASDGGNTVSDDGWVIPGEAYDSPYRMYLIFKQDGSALSFLTTMAPGAIDTDSGDIEIYVPGGEQFTNQLQQMLSYEPSFTAKKPVGIEVLLDYADADIVVFHGYFGVFVYDLHAEMITSAVDFMKTLGCTNVNGSVIVDVAVSADGKTVQLYLSGVEAEMLDTGLDPDTAWYLDTQSGELTPGTYETLQNAFTGLVPANQPASASFMGVEFPDGMAYISCDGRTLGDLRYVRGDKTWDLFDGY